MYAVRSYSFKVAEPEDAAAVAGAEERVEHPQRHLPLRNWTPSSRLMSRKSSNITPKYRDEKVRVLIARNVTPTRDLHE